MSAERQGDLQLATIDGVADRRGGSDRRQLTLQTFIQGSFTPRRRGGRRAGECEALVDWHEPDLLILSLTIVLLSVTDAFFTLTLLTHGAVEANPLLAYILDRFPGYFAVLKMILTCCGVLVLVAMARWKIFKVVRVRTILRFFLLGYAALVGYEIWMLGIVI